MSIRFYDGEVEYVYRGCYSRGDLRSVFFGKDGRDKTVCVLNTDNTYYGNITYETFLASTDEEIINTSLVLIDEGIFTNAKKYFAARWTEENRAMLLPLVDKEGYLQTVCYFDTDLNGVVRKARALLQFDQVENLLPDYIRQVVIHGCNEAAVSVYYLLRKNGYQVCLEGGMWELLGISGNDADETIPEYYQFEVFAEGYKQDNLFRSDINQLLMNSVSCFFQFICDAYERKKDEIFKSSWTEQKKKLREDDYPVILCGCDAFAYNFLMENDIKVEAVRIEMTDRHWQHESSQWFGLPVLKTVRAVEQYPKALYVLPHMEYKTDEEYFFDKLEAEGYLCNQHVVRLSDYVPKPVESIEKLLDAQKIVLVGKKYLSFRAKKYLEKEMGVKANEIFFLDLFQEEDGALGLAEIKLCQCTTDMIFFVVVEHLSCGIHKSWHISEKEIWNGIYYANELLKNGFKNVNAYFGEHLEYVLPDNSERSTRLEDNSNGQIRKARKVIYGHIPGLSGNTLINELLDGHSEILSLGDYSILRGRTIELALYLESLESNDERIEELRKILINKVSFDIEVFLEYLKDILVNSIDIYAKEIFAAIYIAYNQMLGRKWEDKERMALYFEPHTSDPLKQEFSLYWLKANGFEVKVLETRRNIVQNTGSLMRDNQVEYLRYTSVYGFFKTNPSQDKIIIRFEDIKMRPEWTMRRFCQYAEISFEDTLLKTTFEGEEGKGYGEIKGFDLKPVYNQYEDYFDAYDRFRLCLINYYRQTAFRYEGINPEDFTAEEIEQILSRPFKFEVRIKFSSIEEEKLYWYRRKKSITHYMKVEKERKQYYQALGQTVQKEEEEQ